MYAEITKLEVATRVSLPGSRIILRLLMYPGKFLNPRIYIILFINLAYYLKLRIIVYHMLRAVIKREYMF